MRNLKALTVFILLFALLFIIACGGANESASTDDPATEEPAVEEQPAAEEEPTAQEEPAEPAPDLGGYTLKLSMWWDGMPKPDTADGELLVQKLADVEKKYNVKIEYLNVPWDQYVEKFITSVTAGQPFADIIKVDAGWFPGFAKQGLVQPVTDFVDFKAVEDPLDYSPIFDSVGVFGGKQYGFDGPKAEAGTGIFYNKTLLQKLGLKDPNDFVKENNWTWDTFAQLAKDATRDSDGDGKVDSWGITAYHADFLVSLVSSEGGKLFDDVNLKEGISDPRTAQALEFMQKLYYTDKVVRTENPGDWGEQRKMFPEGNVLMMPGYVWEINERANDMGENEWSYVPFPKAPGAVDYVSGYPGLNFWVIPKGAKYPKESLQILFELNDIQSEVEEEYIGQNWYESVVTDEAALENLRLSATKTMIQWHGAIKDYPVWSVADEVVKGAPVSTTIEKYKTDAQAKIDEMFK